MCIAIVCFLYLSLFSDLVTCRYRGESILEVIRRNNPRQREPPLIGTRFDDPIDHKGSAIRSEDPATMKYREVNKKPFTSQK